MKFFKLDEFRCKCGHCQMTDEVKANITALVDCVLDPARGRFGKPMVVNSGHRCEAHNKAVGGAANSQHVKGQAADVCAERQYYGSLEAWKQANLEIARAIVKGRDWDQMICYCDGKELAPRFIHVSWKRKGINRREVRRKMIGGAPIYPKLTAEEMALLMG